MKRLKDLDEEYLAKLSKVLGLIHKSIEYNKKKKNLFIDEYSAYSTKHAVKAKRKRNLGKTCVELANRSIGSHRYEETAKLLWVLCQDLSVYNYYLYKATAIVLENICDYKDEAMHKLAKCAETMKHTNRKDILLEFISYGLNNHTESLHSKLEEFTLRPSFKIIRKHPTIDPLFAAYRTYVKFGDQAASCVESSIGSGNYITDSTISKFKELIEVPGDWDVFVLKLVEMMQSVGQDEEIEEVLGKYAECNSNHLNAHIYLSVYLNSYNPESEKLIPLLQNLAKRWPSDQRVLLLVEKLNQIGENLRCLDILFKFLDYPSNGKSHQAWELLSDCLCTLVSRKEKELPKLVQSMWNERCKLWHWLHFSQLCYLNDDYPLKHIKTVILYYLQSDHEYISAALANFPRIRKELKDLK